MTSATAFAPASIGNVAVGFDVLGQAIAGPGDRCTATRTSRPGVSIDAVRGLPCAVPAEPEKNTAGRAVQSLLEAAGADFGVELVLEKGIPLGSGMGGSAASAVAGVVAANALLDAPLAHADLLQHAMVGENLASGGRPHADNVAPSLHGGLTLVGGGASPLVRSLPAPAGLSSVVVHPHVQVETRAARAMLARSVPFDDVVDQLAAMGGFVAGCFLDDVELVAASLRDVIVEPQRAHLVPGFRAVQTAARECGAIGCSISGSGPSVFAWVREADAGPVAAAMQAAFAAAGLASERWISPLDAPGARVQS